MKQQKILKPVLAAIVVFCGFFMAMADAPFRQHRYSSFTTLPICQDGDIVFIGNSITNMLGWHEALGSKVNVHGRGNSGGYAEEILANLQSMIAGNPSKVFLMIGTNNLGDNGNKYNTPEKLTPLIEEILTSIRNQVPDADVYYESILPTLVGTRTKAKTEATNAAIKEWIESRNDGKLHYIDLYSKFVKESDGSLNNTSASASKTSWSYDGLHLTQKGYKLWLDEIAPLLGEGYQCVFPEEADNLWGGLSSSNGMRVTYFGASPTSSNDILIFGDENINAGEWHELLGSADFKNRGNGWGYATGVLGAMAGNNFLEDALKGNSDKGVKREDPKAVIISAGAYEIQGGTAASVFNSYKKAVSKMREILPETPIFVCTLPPASNNSYNSKIQTFNSNLVSTYGEEENIFVIDVNAAMLIDGERNNDCFMGRSTSATDSFYLSGTGFVKFAQKVAEVLNKELGTQYEAVSDAEMEETLRLFDVLTGIYNGKPNAGNSGEAISGDQVELFYSLLPEIRTKLTRGNISQFFADLDDAYEFARENADPAPVLAYVTRKKVIEPGLENGYFYRTGTELQEPWPYTGTFLGITGNCFLVGKWESIDGEVSINATGNDTPGSGYNNNLWYFENDGFAACGNPAATVDNPYIYVFSAAEGYKINRIHFLTEAMTDADQTWVYDGEQFTAKVGGGPVEIDLKGLDSSEVWLGLVGQNKGASMSDFFIELSETVYEDDNLIVVSPSAGTSFRVNNSTGDATDESEEVAGVWFSHNDRVGLTLRARNANGGYNNIFSAEAGWLALDNGNSSIDIIYELECDDDYTITGVFAELVAEEGSASIPWEIEGETYYPSQEGTELALTGLRLTTVTMNPGDETENPIVPTLFRNFYVTVEKTSGIDKIELSGNNGNQPVEYFDLQGRKVANPSNGIFIRRQGNRTGKVVIK